MSMFDNGIIPSELIGNYPSESTPILPPTKDLDLLDVINTASSSGPVYQPSASSSSSIVDDRLNSFINKGASGASLASPTFFDYDRSQVERYTSNTRDFNALGYVPSLGAENEYRYARLQTWGDVWSNGLTGMFSLAGNTFVEGWKGWGNLIDAFASTSWDEAKMDLMGSPEDLLEQDKVTKNIMNKYAIYNLPEYDEGILNRKFFGDMLQQSGFALGTIAQFLSEELITLGLSTEFSLAKLGISAPKWAGRIVTKADVAKDMVKLGTPIWKSDVIPEFLVTGARKLIPFADTGYTLAKYGKAGAGALQLGAIGVGGVRRFLSEANMAFTEARMEAAGTYGELYNKLYDEELFKTGETPTADNLARMEKLAKDAAYDNFKVNTGILMLSNRLQFDNLFSKFSFGRKLLGEGTSEFAEDVLKLSGKRISGEFKGVVKPKIYEKGALGTLGLTGQIAKDFGKRKAAWEATKSLGKNIFKWEASEGIQELFQETSNKALQEYYYDLYHGAKGSELTDYISKAAEEQYSTQGLKTFLMGALTGRLLSPINFAVGKAKEKIGADPLKKAERKKQLGESIQALNGFYENPNAYLPEHIANVKVQDKAAKNMQEAIASRDAYVFHNNKDSAFAKMISAAIKTDMIDGVIETLRGYGEAFNDNEFKEAFGFDKTEENVASTKDFFNKIADNVIDFHKTWRDLKNRFGDLVIPELYKEGTPERKTALRAKRALDDAIEVLATVDYKARKATMRAGELQVKMANIPVLGATVATAFRNIGVIQNTEAEIDLLKTEIKNLESQETKDNATKDLLEAKKEQLASLEEWKENYSELANMERGDKLKSDKAKKALVKYLNSKNKESKIDTVIKEDQLDSVYANLLDYIELNKDNKEYIDAYNILANPIKFVQVHERILTAMDAVEAKKLLEHLKEMQKAAGVEEDETPKAVTTIVTKDKEGKEVTFEIKEGENYITESSPKKRIYKGKVPVIQYDQDIIKIVSIDDRGISFTYNDEKEVVIMSVDEFSQIGKLYPLSSMTDHERIYFKNRDVVFDLNVFKKTGKPHYTKGKYANKDFSSAGINVKARLELIKENGEYVLKIAYINPVTNVKESIYYNAEYLKKYAANKKDILDITESEDEVVSKRTEARRQSQLKMLNEALEDVMSKSDKLVSDRNKNEEEYNKIKKQLEDYIAEIELIEEEFQNKPYVRGRKSKVRIELEQRKEVLLNLVQNAERLIQNLQIESQQLQKQEEVLNQLLEYYFEGIEEIEQSSQPFTMVDGKIYTSEQERIAEIQTQEIIKPSREISTDQISGMLDETEIELALVNERISILQNMIDYSNKLLERINRVTDLFDTLAGITDKKQLINQLVLMKRQEKDADNKKTIQNLINSLNDGDSMELAYIFELVDRVVDSKKELKELLEQARYLQDKYDRLALAYQQRGQISSLQKRVEMLKVIQEGIIRGYQILQQKQGIKQEGTKIITKPNSVPVEDEMIKGTDALFTTEPIVDIVPGSEEEAETFKQMEAFAPVLNENALFKTAGRHFADKDDTEITSPQEARFFKFSETAKLSDENGSVFYLMPITKDSKEFQELRSEGFEDDIRLVVVRRDAMGNFKPVGMDGNILENPTKDNMVYTGMHGSKELLGDDADATYEWLKDNFAIYDKKTQKNRVTKEQALAFATYFKQVRNAIKEKVKAGETVVLPIIDKSPGVYNREPLVGGYDEDGNPTPQRPQELSLEGRLIEDNPDFTNLKHPDGRPVKVEISKNDNRVKAGRAMVVRPGEPPIVVYNRKFTAEEQENIINILKRLSELFIQKNSELGLNEEQLTEFQTALRYLQGVTYWSPVQEGKEPSPFQLSVQSGLNIGADNILFTAESIETNKDKILQALQYHKVNNTLLNDKNKTESFYDVKVIDGKIVRGKQYVNYQHYLLAERPGGSVLYTNIKPYTSPSENKTEAQNYQLKNVYFKFDASGFVAEPVQAPGDQPTTTPTNIKQYSVSQSQIVVNGVKFYEIQNDIPKEGKVTFVTKRKNGDELYLHTEYKNGKYEIFQILDEKGNDLTIVEVAGKPAKDFYQDELDKRYQVIVDNAQIVEAGKDAQSEILDVFKGVFIRVEEYAKQGETVSDVKVAQVLTSQSTPVTPAPVSDKKAIVAAGIREQGTQVSVEVIGDSGKEFLLVIDRNSKGRVELFSEKKDWGDGTFTYRPGEGEQASQEQIVKLYNKYVPESVRNLITEWQNSFTGSWAAPETEDGKRHRAIEEKLNKELAALEGAKPATAPVVGKTLAASGITFDDFVNQKYKDYVNEARSQGATPLSKEEYTAKYNKLLNLEYKSKVQVSAQTSAQNLLDMAKQAKPKDDYDANARVGEITAATKTEDIAKFKKWLSKVLPQIPLDILDELVDGKYMGQFVNGMIRMYKFAEEGTGFHEAFEAVWNAYLSPEKQQALIDEYKKRKDYKSQPSYLWAVANYKTQDEKRLIKEALAEEFREYMLKEGTEVKAESPKRNTFFRRLWNWLKKILGLTKEKVAEIEDETTKLFGQIAKGEFKDATPVQNFDSSVKHNRASVSGTSVEFTQQLMEGLTAIFFSKLNNESYKAKGYTIEKMFDEDNNIFEDLFKASWSTIFNRFMPGLNDVMQRDEFKYATPEVQTEFINQYREYRIAEDQKIASNLYFQKERVLNNEIYNTEVKEQFKNYLSQFGLKFKQVEDVKKSEEEIAEIEGKEENANTLGIRDVIYVDPTSLTNPTVRLLILSLPDNKTDESGKVTDVRNKLNLPSLVSYKRKMNILLNELSDVVPMMRKQEDGTFRKTSALEEMFNKLDKKFKDPIYKFRYKDGYQWIENLKSRLKYDTLKNGGVVSDDDVRLLVAFETSFTRNRNNPLKIIVGADGKIRHVNAVSVNTKEKIREEWRNGIKEKAYKVDISKLDTAGIVYISPTNTIEINLSSPRLTYILGASDVKGHLGAFNALGISLSTKPENLSETNKNIIKNAYNSLKYVLEDAVKNNKTIKYDSLFGTDLIGGPLNALLELELNFRSEDTLLSHQTADGKTQYAITLPSEISYVLHSLNSANTLEEFIMSNPQYGKVVGDIIKLNPYNSTSEILSPGGIVFDAKGRKREGVKIDYEYISGMAAERESDGENTDKLNFNDKIIQEIYHILRGSYFTVINADKSSEFAVKMGHFVKMSDISNLGLIEDKYINALKAEVMHALRFHFYPNNIQNHQDRILELGHFSNVPGLEKGSNLRNYFEKLVKDTKITKKTKIENATLIFEALTENFVSTVKNEGILKDYVESQVEETKQWLVNKEIVKTVEVKAGFIVINVLNRFKALGIPKDSDAISGIDTKEMSEAEFNKLARFLVVNRQLAVYEQHKLFYGHPALYKDLAKRSSGANSQKNVVSENPHVISWMEQNKPRYDGRVRDADNPIMRSISYADPKVTSPYVKYIAEQLFKDISTKVDKKKAEQLIGAKFNEDGSLKSIVGGKGTYISGYINMDEADGQAMIMPDHFRDMLYLSGMLSKEQEALLDYENALEIVDRSDKSHPYYNPKYTKEQIQKAKDILSKPKPEAILQVLKPQGFGFQNTDGMSHINFLKNSVFPLTWSRVKNNPEMMSKYIDAKNQGVDIIDFGSGHKVGAMTKPNGKLTPFYNEDGTISKEVPILQDIFSKYFGIQVSTPDYAKNVVIFGSQIRKLILSDLPESLKPYAEEYKNVLNALLDIEREALLQELGLKQNEDGSYDIENVGKLMETLRQEAIKRNLPDNVVEMLDTFIDDNKEVPKYPLDANPARERIESVLNSLVDNRIIRTEMFGKANVQVSSTLFAQGRKLLYLKDGTYQNVEDYSKLSKKEKESVTLSSTNLNFYNEDKRYLEVYTPWYFKGITPQEAGFVQNEEGIWVAPEGKDFTDLLNSIGFRIPTQGLNSIDSIVIKGFLDPSYGDMVVVPSEMVGKSGSDFDIDKLNMFLANYYVSKKTNEIKYISYSTSNSELENRYSKFINDRVDSDIKLYVATLQRYSGEKSSLQNKYNNNKDVIFSKFNDARKQYNDQYEEAKEEIFKIANNTKTNNTLIEEYKKQGYNLFKTLPPSIKQPFYDLKDEGVLSVAENKALAERILQANPKAKYASTLMQMIQYHEAMLDVYAQINNWTNEQLNALNDRANTAFGKWENWKEESLEKTREDFLKSLKQYRVEYIQELARISGQPTFEEFKKLPIEKQNGKKALQNRVLEIMKTIVEHPDNQRQLLTPNSSAKLKKLSENILELKGIKRDDANMTKLSEWVTMSETRETFVTSKQLVGVGALQITSHAMSQIGEVELTGTYKDYDGTTRQVKIKLPNSNTNKLDLTVDDDGMYIFDLFNEALTGSVDAAKDPFIFDIRLNLETASTWFYLTKRGVSQENIALMFNQPVIDDYFRYRDANKTFVNEVNDEDLYFNEVIIKAASLYYTQGTGNVIDTTQYPDKTLALFRGIQQQFKQYTPEQLAKAISSKTLTKEQNLMQVAILMDMLDYKTQADKLSNFIRGISYDTTKTKNIVESYLQQSRYNRAVNDKFIKQDSLDRVFDKTFLGKVKEVKDDVRNMFEKFFVVLNPKSLPAFEPILEKLDDDGIFMTNEDKAEYLNRYQNFFIAYILQNTPFGNNERLNQYFNLFTDGKNESLAKRLKRMKDKYPDSLALKNLFPVINQNRLSTDNIKMFNNKMSSYDVNVISESIDILYSQAEMIGDFELKEFIDNLARLAILQSGVQLSPVTFTKVLPLNLYAGLTADIFKNYANSPDVVNVDQVWKAFHQNNYKNNKIVPKQKYSAKYLQNGLLVIRGDRNIARNQYIKMYVPVDGVDTKNDKLPFDERFKLNLYERIKITDTTGSDVTLDKSVVKYRPINKLGNGMYLVETTPDPLTEASRFAVNGDVNESMHDEAVMAWRKQVSLETIESGLPEFDKLPGRSSTRTMTYAGIGSRETPKEVLGQMTELAKELEAKGYTLRSGAAEGADTAFEKGVSAKKEIFPGGKTAGEREMKIAREIHPNPEALDNSKKPDFVWNLMARNTNQVFGENLDTPVDFVIAWTPDALTDYRDRSVASGGTGQAIEMASRKGIPVINMANPNWRQELDRVLSGATQASVTGPSKIQPEGLPSIDNNNQNNCG